MRLRGRRGGERTLSIILQDVDFTYLPGTPLEERALREVCLEVFPGEVLGVLGSAGSGKTTLLRLLKGILEPARGEIVLEGERLEGTRGLARLRDAAGLVMQDPELHLFAATVEEDVCFGPRNRGMSREAAREEAAAAMDKVGLSFSEMRRRNPLALSVGEQRKVALAGVLAMRPRYLLLDEMSSGLDGDGRRRLRRIILDWKEEGNAVVLVTHDFEEMQGVADRVAVMADGTVLGCGPARGVLQDAGLLGRAGYGLPPLLELELRLRERGVDLEGCGLDPEDMALRLRAALRGQGGEGGER